jgi:hypothetical protein
MRGFLEARSSWEPGSSLTTGAFSLFCLLPKVSATNVRWTEHDSYLSFSQKSLDWHFLAWPWPSQATQYSLGMESPKGYPYLWIGWLSLVLWQLPSALLEAIVRAFLATKSFAVGFSTYPCHMACISKSVTKDVISLSDYIPNSTEAPRMRHAIVGADHSASLSHDCEGQVRKVVLLWYCFCCVSSPFPVLPLHMASL